MNILTHAISAATSGDITTFVGRLQEQDADTPGGLTGRTVKALLRKARRPAREWPRWVNALEVKLGRAFRDGPRVLVAAHRAIERKGGRIPWTKAAQAHHRVVPRDVARARGRAPRRAANRAVRTAAASRTGPPEPPAPEPPSRRRPVPGGVT
jgi:hypothetical protein